MANKKINKKDVARLLSQWREEFSLFVPSKGDGASTMALWDGKDTGFLEWYRNSIVPTKSSFFPPAEKMFQFQKDKEGYQIEPEILGEQKQLIFGIRPCDANALAILDMVFKDTYEDPYYLPRRRNTILVGLTCIRPYDSCFCTSLGSSPSDATNVDLMFTDTGGEFLIEAVTEAGKALIDRTSGLKEATGADEDKATEAKEASARKITREIDTSDIDTRLVSDFEDEDYWQKIAAKCISCGICTLLCPTCYCFDINDEVVKKQGARMRSWDSCAFSVYTKMPMENPRTEKWRRVRQKVSHKYGFYPMNFGVIACTGCGRCIRLCPVNWDITQTLANLLVPS